MSFVLNQNEQIKIEDKFINLTKREVNFLKKSWAEGFSKHIFPKISEQRFSVLFCENNGRPNAPINVIIGSLILKEMLGLTDDELFQSIMFDLRFQYALNLTSFTEIPYSDRTASRFRERIFNYEKDFGIDLIKDEIENLAQEFAKMMKINPNMKRMDSVMISANCKNMSRLELIYTCVSNMVNVVNSTGQGILLTNNLEKYLHCDNKNSVCYNMKKTEVETKLETVSKDALELFKLCGCDYFDFEEYKTLERMINEQFEKGALAEKKAY